MGFSSVDPEKYATRFEARRAALVRALLPPGEGRRAIDVGCGSGFFSAMLRSAGWTVTGIDAHPVNVAAVRALGIDVVADDAVRALSSMPARQADLVLALEIIEHLPLADGYALLEAARRAVNVGGTLVVSTPNRLSPEGLPGYLVGEKLLRRPWRAWDQTHVHVYSSFELLGALRGAGWRATRVIGYHFDRGRLRSPLSATHRFPLNRFGFITIASCEAV